MSRKKIKRRARGKSKVGVSNRNTRKKSATRKQGKRRLNSRVSTRRSKSDSRSSVSSSIAQAIRSGAWQRAIAKVRLKPKRHPSKPKKRHSPKYLQEVIKRAVKRFKGRVSEEEIAEVIEEAKASDKFVLRRASEKEVKKNIRGLKLNKLEPEQAHERLKRLQNERFPSYTLRELYSFWKSP